jgi:hypothetical protein
MRFVQLGVLALVCTVAWTVEAALIDVGSHQLLPNQAGQPIDIFVSGGEQVYGVDLFLQVADGYTGPVIQNVDILTGTIFDGNNQGEIGQGPVTPQVWVSGTVTSPQPPETVAAEGLLAHVLIDTSGFSSGSWDFKITDTLMGDSTLINNFNPPVMDVRNGRIYIGQQPPPFIIPEPSMWIVALGLIGLGIGAGTLRRRR